MPVSTTARPVTVIADVDVKSVSIQPMGLDVAAGVFNKRVPNMMKNKNTSTSSWDGLN
ncbi:hypothetical protein DJ88_4387 [Bacillus paralicheniformis]|nr:hypothetical protein DJ88_4387 [Bacillus paralicheniformis]